MSPAKDPKFFKFKELYFELKQEYGKELSIEKYIEILTKYKKLASCVLFMGGEWHLEKLMKFFEIAQKMNFNTCLYTGEVDVENSLKSKLTWLKTGYWNESLGGLDSKYTNQKFTEVKSNKTLNHLFLNN